MSLRIQDFDDAKFESTQNLSLIRYNNTDQRFENPSPDDYLETTTLPQEFVDFVSLSINLNNFTNKTIDGGTF